MHCERMIKSLVRHYDVIINCNYFPYRWLHMLDVVIKKRKGSMIHNLRIMKTIEADSQFLMMTF